MSKKSGKHIHEPEVDLELIKSQLGNLPEEKIPELLNSVGISIRHTSVFSGPLPPPDQLIEYK